MAGTEPRPGGVWRDLAATAVEQVSASLRDRLNTPAGTGSNRHETGDADRLDDNQDPAARPANPPGRPTKPAARPAKPVDRAAGTLGADLKDLVSAGIRSTTQSLQDYQDDRERRKEQRERRKAEAPMRKARNRARACFAGAMATGLIALGAVGGAVGFATDDDGAAEAVPLAIVAIGGGTGAAMLTRDGRRYRAEADRHERRLSAVYGGAVSIDAPGVGSSPLVPKSSAAAEPLRRLMAQQRSLLALQPDLQTVAPELIDLARESEQSLHGTAERIVRLERASEAAGGDEVIAEPLRRMVDQLDDGVLAHQRLLEAAATVVVELNSTHDGTHTRLDVQEAADRLAALAVGIREVRHVENEAQAIPRLAPGTLPAVEPPAADRGADAGAPQPAAPRQPRRARRRPQRH